MGPDFWRRVVELALENQGEKSIAIRGNCRSTFTSQPQHAITNELDDYREKN